MNQPFPFNSYPNMINMVYSKKIRASKMFIVDDFFIIILIALEKYVVIKFLLFKIS
jgi:hypothetical protein